MFSIHPLGSEGIVDTLHGASERPVAVETSEYVLRIMTSIINERPRLLCRFGIGVLYPTLESFKAIESAGSKDDTQVSLRLFTDGSGPVVVVVGRCGPFWLIEL